MPPPPGTPTSPVPGVGGDGGGQPGYPLLEALTRSQVGLPGQLPNIPRMDWLPGLPMPPGVFETGQVAEDPRLKLHDVQGCTKTLADAVSYQLAGSIRAGLTLARAAVQACPEIEEGGMIVAVLELLAQQTRQAAKTLEAVHSRGKRAAEALTLMGIWCLYLGDTHGALENLNEALQKDPLAWRARLALSTLYFQQGKREAALRVLAPLARQAGVVRSIQDVDLLDLIPFTQELLQDAIRRYHPTCVDCRRTLVDLYATQGMRRSGLASHALWKQAIAELTRLVEERPDDVETRLALGRAFNTLGYYKAAAEVFSAGLRSGDRRFEILLGGALLDQELPDRALPYFEASVKREPNNPEFWGLLGTAQRILGRKEAIDSLRRATELDPSKPHLFSDLGQVLMSQGYSAEALDAYRKALALQPNLRQARYGLATALNALGRPQEAQEELKKYQLLLDQIQQHLTVSETRNNLDSAVFEGLEHLRAGRGEPARVALTGVLAEEPAHAIANLGLASLLVGEGKASQAMPHLERLLEVSGRANPFIKAAAGVQGKVTP